VQAAFFDLDKTVIAKASMVAFGPQFRRAGLLSRWLLLRALYGQLVYLWLGADEARLARLRNAALALTKGWDQAHISAIVAETLEEVIEPHVYEEALELLKEHRAAGRLVVIISASPEEVVAPLAAYLGADEAVATRAKLDEDGRYSGELERYCYGPAKADAMRAMADERGIDLAESWAYSDSVTDVPMLEAVGHPVAVNPDRSLLKVARARDWEVRRFIRPVRMRDRVSMPKPGARAAAAGSGVGVVIAAVVVWWWLRREPAEPPAPPRGRFYASRSLRAATAPRATRRASSRSFFMAAR
jgi:HAD superfamily hydrolase (TIGR01490 family)